MPNVPTFYAKVPTGGGGGRDAARELRPDNPRLFVLLLLRPRIILRQHLSAGMERAPCPEVCMYIYICIYIYTYCLFFVTCDGLVYFLPGC